ncbi:MAG: hypothetical protein HUU35_10775, partial [Armatimonadetes bacterium]|nr:hypothetical protein [Armatimonadota bacterium]
RLVLTVADGLVVGLTNRLTGEVHAEAELADLRLPRGLGHLAGGVPAMEALHGPWGTQHLNQDQAAGKATPTQHYPSPQGSFAAEPITGGVRGVWTGLTNGQTEFPTEVLRLEAVVDEPTGRVRLTASASSPTPGVYGLQAPLANLHPDHRVYVPSFGGVMYDRTSRPALITLGGTPFWEAPVVALEGQQGSLGLWIEDADFAPNFFFMNWSGRSFSVAIEHLNYLPYDGLTTVGPVTWQLDAFAGGWVDAMTPYRSWYAAAFAPELAARAAVGWADRIRVVVDHLTRSDEAYRLLAATVDPETVLIHDWNARAPQFDHDLPDWSPRPGYVDSVRMAQRYGFRTMAYVNTYCVNVGSPVFERDRIAEFGLTRKIAGISRYAATQPTLATAKPGQLLYLDPLSPGWRKYHTDMMLTWRQVTGTDANYEDVGGTAGDFGNGQVDGLRGAQGGREQFRELLRRNPAVPMASEYAPDHMAFAVRWPLRYQQVWGNDAVRTWWMEHQRPVSAYIHGPLAYPWIPVINAESEFARHVVVACSDALGGMAQMAATLPELQATAGTAYHLRRRAQLFAHRQLTPSFRREREAPTLACRYTDSAGREYQYHATANVQQMLGPDGAPLYQRVTGVNEFATPLALPGWPAATGEKLLGLNPAVRYALHPGAPERTKVQVTGLPAGVRVARYDSTPGRTVLVLAGVDEGGPARGEIQLQPLAKFAEVLLNDEPQTAPAADQAEPMTYTTAFPAHLVLVEGTPAAVGLGREFGDGADKGRFFSRLTGLERGGEYTVPHRASWPVAGITPAPGFLFVNGGADGEVTLDWLVRVPNAQAALLVAVRNNQIRYGNGGIARLYLNGREVRAADLGPRPNPAWREGMEAALKTTWETAIHLWRVPVGHLAGRPLAVTIASDAKGSNNADQLWWTRPRFVEDPAQQAQFVRLGEDGQPLPE